MKLTRVFYDDLLAVAAKRGKRSIDEPKVYFPSASNPDYRKEELRYVAAHMFAGKKKKVAQKPSVVYYLDHITQGWSEKSGLGPFKEAKDKYVIEALKLFGETALGRGDFPFRLTDEANELGGAACRVLGYLRNQALSDKNARRRLKEILKTIQPDTRGRKGVNPDAVRFFYFQGLFRIHHIKNVLKFSPESRSGRVSAACNNFGVPIQTIREFFGLDEEDNILRGSGPLTLRDMARELTARHFGITHQTISNILAL